MKKETKMDVIKKLQQKLTIKTKELERVYHEVNNDKNQLYARIAKLEDRIAIMLARGVEDDEKIEFLQKENERLKTANEELFKLREKDESAMGKFTKQQSGLLDTIELLVHRLDD